jgi:hypothetical protein
MKIINFKQVIILASILFLANLATAQVEFAVKYEHYDNTTDTVKVYLRSSSTYNPPFNQTASGQITVKVPTGMVPNIQNVTTNPGVSALIRLYNNGIWVPNSRVDNPASQPGVDFISFGLSNAGTQNIEYQSNSEIPLFSFAMNGPCDGLIELIDNQNDPFVNNGSTSANNAITILGANGNAYSNNYNVGLSNCDDYDNDGVPNATDQCPFSAPGSSVNANGCTDTDGDGFFPDVASTDPTYDPNDTDPCIPDAANPACTGNNCTIVAPTLGN